ncbi:hypothetical protein LENED_010964 [Lentinula edodes]|uniref:Uncharacterized protein n=1 Tax=Lentinula edodes TaxID=5353 RepID=A0A1Q3ENU3_LENED|nr:hypothetical protein LENED_010964 [Lentinula edodes]
MPTFDCMTENPYTITHTHKQITLLVSSLNLYKREPTIQQCLPSILDEIPKNSLQNSLTFDYLLGMTTPMSPPTSTPRKPSSAPRSHSVPLPVEKQLELINLLRMEIGDQTWQFDAGRVAHMLSPKKLKPESPWSHENGGYTADPLDLPSTDDFHYLVDDLDVQAAFEARFSKHKFDYHSPSSIGERSHYDPLVCFLNECVADW